MRNSPKSVYQPLILSDRTSWFLKDLSRFLKKNDTSLFVSFRKHLSLEVVNTITKKIIAIKTELEEDPK